MLSHVINLFDNSCSSARTMADVAARAKRNKEIFILLKIMKLFITWVNNSVNNLIRLVLSLVVWNIWSGYYNPVQKLSRQLRKTVLFLCSHKQFKTLFKDYIVRLKIISLYIYKDLRQDVRFNESRDHYLEVGNLVPSPRCGFCFEAAFKLWCLKLTISVYIRNATFQFNLSLVSLFLWMIVSTILEIN